MTENTSQHKIKTVLTTYLKRLLSSYFFFLPFSRSRRGKGGGLGDAHTVHKKTIVVCYVEGVCLSISIYLTCCNGSITILYYCVMMCWRCSWMDTAMTIIKMCYGNESVATCIYCCAKFIGWKNALANAYSYTCTAHAAMCRLWSVLFHDKLSLCSTSLCHPHQDQFTNNPPATSHNNK